MFSNVTLVQFEMLDGVHERFYHLVVVGTEIFKVSKTDVREADDDRDDQNNESEHGGRG